MYIFSEHCHPLQDSSVTINLTVEPFLLIPNVTWSPFLGHRLGVKEYRKAHKGIFALSNNVAH